MGLRFRKLLLVREDRAEAIMSIGVAGIEPHCLGDWNGAAACLPWA